jgi:predicted HAD superfamily Cof-like phosphohydrolase
MSLRHITDKVAEWCDATDIEINKSPTTINMDRYRLRFNLMAEENVEYLEACAAEDVTEIADAIGDMLYILIGTALEHGMQDHLERVFNEIHRSNMSKMGEDGKAIRREDGKILKGPNYFRPNIDQIIKS